MDLKEKGWEDMDWINLSQYRNFQLVLVKALIDLGVPKMWGSFLTS